MADYVYKLEDDYIKIYWRSTNKKCLDLMGKFTYKRFKELIPIWKKRNNNRHKEFMVCVSVVRDELIEKGLIDE